MSDPFSARFESRFRGSREEIKARQAVYLPLLALLGRLFPDGALLDLGCGRGEWLELASEAGWDVTGVDAQVRTSEVATASELDIRQADALDYLRMLPPDSFSIITAFHLVEHLPFAALKEFVGEIHRVLQPGGLLILETPNPENLTVGTCSFHVDPTHLTPLPPDLLNFLVESYGFARSCILRLNGLPVGVLPDGFSLVRVLYGVSPDFAVFAQKEADPSLLKALPWPPLGPGGGSLLEEAAAFDQGLHLEIGALHSAYATLDGRIRELVEDGKLSRQELHAAYAGRIRELELSRQELHAACAGRIRDLELSRQELHGVYSGRIKELELSRQALQVACADRVEELNASRQELRAVYASRSWRYTAPYRWLTRSCMALGRGLFSVPAAIGSALQSPRIGRRQAAAWVGNHPWLQERVLRLLHKFPRLKSWLKRWLRGNDRSEEMSAGEGQVVAEEGQSPRTARILSDIRREQQQQGEQEKGADPAVPHEQK